MIVTFFFTSFISQGKRVHDVLKQKGYRGVERFKSRKEGFQYAWHIIHYEEELEEFEKYMKNTNKSAEGNKKLTGKWYWQNKNTWKAYKDDQNKIIEEAYEQDANEVDIGDYTINFKQLKQVNKKETFRTRKVREKKNRIVMIKHFLLIGIAIPDILL